MRSRNIKPGFFQNEYLVELDPQTRLLFIGLWLMADREGRLEDRPKKVKMQVFPADPWDIDPMLDQLAGKRMIVRYEVDSARYIEIPSWSKHQNPHVNERASTIPAPCENSTNPADSLIPDSLIPEKDKGQRPSVLTTSKFDDFWETYPKKRKKKRAREIWRSKKLNALAEHIIEDVELRKTKDERWTQGYIPDPTTYLNQERWEDELTDTVTPPRPKPRVHVEPTPEELAEDRRKAEKELAALVRGGKE